MRIPFFCPAFFCPALVEYAAERAVELPDWFRAALAEYQ